MKNDETGTALERAVSAFLLENEGSVLLFSDPFSARILVGGFTSAQYKAHALATIFTLGAWLPVFVTVAVFRRRQVVYMFTDLFGKIHTMYEPTTERAWK